jgi:serine/threonine-protein kinase
VGTILAHKYKLVRLIGSGGMGAVFEAENIRTGKRVAVKLLLASGESGMSPEVAARFVREARAATRVEHPHIVQVFDMDAAEDGALFIVQELLSGADLRRVLDRRHRLSARETVETLLPIMGALVLAHREGVVHRDIKPENIFLTRTRSGNVVPKIIDFGLAGERGDPLVGRITKTGTTMGTPLYMSPEQAKGDRDVDGQTDVWAMGAVFYECLGGQTPYTADSYNALIARLLLEDATPLHRAHPDVERELAAVIDGALRRDRAQRHSSMASFLEAVLECGVLTPEPWSQSLRASLRNSARHGIAHAPTVAATDAAQHRDEETRGEQSTLSMQSAQSLLDAVETESTKAVSEIEEEPSLARSARHEPSVMRRSWGFAVVAVVVVIGALSASTLFFAPQQPIASQPSVVTSELRDADYTEVPAARVVTDGGVMPSHPCVALWEGAATDSFGGEGTTTLLVSRPTGPRCGLLTQHWGEVTCEFDLTDCRATESGIDATGTTSSRRCRSPSEVVVECTATQALLHEGVDEDRTTATLDRR